MPSQLLGAGGATIDLSAKLAIIQEGPAGHSAQAPTTAPSRLGSLWRRLVRYRRQHGVAGVLRRILEILWAHALRPFTLLAFYYPQVARDVLAWALRTRPTVLQVVQGRQHVEGGRVAVFVMWQPDRTPWYVLNALRALREVGANVLLVVNHPLDEGRQAELAPLCAQIMIRDNTGLDMGAYKDAVAHLADARIGRLLLLNDSIYYFEAGLAALFERLFASRAALCASHENVQFTPHLQSFCISVSGRLVRSQAFRRFWRRYIPVQSRRWAIHKGELGLSAALLPMAGEAEVLYRAEDLASLSRDAGEIAPAEAIGHLPLPQRLQVELEPQERLSGKHLADLLKRGSQVHTGGFLFRQFRGAPILKRDLVFRQQYTAEECDALLRAAGHEGHLAEIMADLTRKGPPPAYGSLHHAKWATGLI